MLKLVLVLKLHVLASLTSRVAASEVCAPWCNFYTCSMPACADCATTIPDECGPGGTCASWCNAYTCNHVSCGGCAHEAGDICETKKFGDYCGSWCNSYLCPFFADPSSSTYAAFFSGFCDGCSSLCPFLENGCTYDDSVLGAAMPALTGYTCADLRNRNTPSGTGTTVTSPTAGQTYYCSGESGEQAGVFAAGTANADGTVNDGSSFLSYASLCPEQCTRSPVCASPVDNDAFMVQAFGYDCATYGQYDYCSLTTAEWAQVVILHAACPATCNINLSPSTRRELAAAVKNVPMQTAGPAKPEALKKGAFTLSASTMMPGEK